MSVFRILDIALPSPILVVARDQDHAADMLVQAMCKGFGQMPDTLYKIDRLVVEEPTDPVAANAVRLDRRGCSGFVHSAEQFDAIDPVADGEPTEMEWE